MLFNDKILIRSFLFSSLIAMMLMFAGCTNNRECEIGGSKINDEDIDFSVTDEQINDELLNDSSHVDEVEISNDREIVWLGDSLTQGSLGHDSIPIIGLGGRFVIASSVWLNLHILLLSLLR